MRFLQTADWHVTLKTTYARYRMELMDRATDVMAKRLSGKSTSFIVLAGDIFDNVNPTEEERVFVSEQVKKLSDAGKVYWILGNHDKNELFSAIQSTKILIGSNPNLRIFIQPTIVKIKGFKVAFVSHDIEIPKIIKSMKNAGADILFSHFSIIGGSLSSSNFKLKRWIDPELLRKFLYVGLGDLHEQQSNKRIHYSGSLVKVNFGERTSLKGFLDVTCKKETRENKVKFVATPDIRMEQVKLSKGQLVNYTNMKKFTDYKDVILKIRYFSKDRGIVSKYKEKAMTEGARGITLDIIKPKEKGKDIKRINYKSPFNKVFKRYLKQDIKLKKKQRIKIYKYAIKVARDSGIY